MEYTTLEPMLTQPLQVNITQDQDIVFWIFLLVLIALGVRVIRSYLKEMEKYLNQDQGEAHEKVL